jgi:hypothetical protein
MIQGMIRQVLRSRPRQRAHRDYQLLVIHRIDVGAPHHRTAARSHLRGREARLDRLGEQQPHPCGAAFTVLPTSGLA